MTRQEVIDALKARAEASATVVSGAIVLILGFVQAVRDAADDAQELQGVLSAFDAQANDLAAAVAAVPPAETPPADPPADPTT